MLLHGLGRSAMSMSVLEYRLKKMGFRVRSHGYPSTRVSISQHASCLDDILSSTEVLESEAVHFVTHSLGGIILRKLLQDRPVDNLGRVVMLAPPNQGSEIVDKLRPWPLYRWVMGPSGQELGTDAQSVPKNLGKVDFELGVITGEVNRSLLGALFLSSPNDGKVTVEGARVEGMQDFLVVPHSHSFIMNSEHVANQVVHFLQNGKFKTVSD